MCAGSPGRSGSPVLRPRVCARGLGPAAGWPVTDSSVICCSLSLLPRPRWDRLWYNGRRRKEGSRGHHGPVGGALPGVPRAPAGRGLPDARLAERGRRAVQETWLRLGGSDAGEVGNLRAWLTTVVSRVCLDMLRTGWPAARNRSTCTCRNRSSPPPRRPEQQALLADSVGLALLVILDTLSPAERLAFVCTDLRRPVRGIGPILDARRPPPSSSPAAPGTATGPAQPRRTGQARAVAVPSWPPRAAGTSRRCWGARPGRGAPRRRGAGPLGPRGWSAAHRGNRKAAPFGPAGALRPAGARQRRRRAPHRPRRQPSP